MIHKPEDEIRERFLYAATLIKVIDGDTVDVEVDLGFKIYHEIRLRLLGIDAPEVRGVEKEAGKITTEVLKNLLNEDVELFIETQKTGKYGRYLATIWVTVEEMGSRIADEDRDDSFIDFFNGQEWVNINEYLVFHKYASRYE